VLIGPNRKLLGRELHATNISKPGLAPGFFLPAFHAREEPAALNQEANLFLIATSRWRQNGDSDRLSAQIIVGD
jgi:hypothetical protein